MNFFNKFDKLKVKYKDNPGVKISFLLGIISILFIFVGGSYAFIFKSVYTQSINTISAGTLVITLENTTPVISVNNAIPTPDDVALSDSTTYDFTLKNTGSINAKYKLSLINSCTVGSSYTVGDSSVKADVCIPAQYVKAGISKDGEDFKVVKVDSDGNIILDDGILAKLRSSSYKLKLWLDYDTPNSYNVKNKNTIMSYKIQLYSEQTTEDYSLDKSGANAPTLTANMIPVYYDSTSNVWRKADANNSDKSNQWYDYDNKMWANAVTVSEQDGYAESVASSSTVSLSNNVTYSKVPSSGEAALVENDTVYSNYSFNSSTGLYTLNGTTTSVTKSNFQSLSGNYYCQSGSNTACTIMAYCSSYSSGGMFQGTVRAVYVANIYTSTSTVEQKYLSSSYTFNKNTGVYTLSSPSLSAYSTSSVGKYTCDSSTSSTCSKMYKIVIAEENKVTKADVYEKRTNFRITDKYKNARVGTEISMNDISTMWVWIPRYTYTYLNTNTPQSINIKFEEGTNSSGTIKCVDAVTGTSSTSETCTDTTNGGLKAGTSTYTHPAFWWDKNDNNVREENEELTGIWVGKFEISSGQIIKPNVTSLRSQTVNQLYTGIYNMRNSGNAFGFSTTDETHMMKNMEWGAVTYLSHSKYGINKEIAINSANTYTTGCGPQSADSTTSGATCNSYTTALGQSASTTGNVYGVYDMSGGSREYVMGNMVNSSGAFYSSNAGFSSTPNAKYYDKYSYDASSNTTYTRGKLGDATKEMAPVSSSNTSWYSDYSYFPVSSSPWFLRGGSYGNGASAGAFSFRNVSGNAVSVISSRAVLGVLD